MKKYQAGRKEGRKEGRPAVLPVLLILNEKKKKKKKNINAVNEKINKDCMQSLWILY